MEAIWTPFKKLNAAGVPVQITDRSIRTRADWEQVIQPGAADIADKMQYVREYNLGPMIIPRPVKSQTPDGDPSVRI